MAIDRERWRLVSELLDQTLELSPTARSEFLDRACAGDGELRAEVEALLEADRQTEGILEAPAYAAALFDDIRQAAEAGAPAAENRGVPEADELVGRALGPYRVIRRLGAGGMGVVYEAEDTRLKRHVALKLLPRGWAGNPAAKERFIREARAASALDHPNICAIHDISETEGGRMFLVMAYYQGETLARRLKRGPLAIEEACDVAVQVARGLERAHVAGIVHRDVKPANVMVTGGREVRGDSADRAHPEGYPPDRVHADRVHADRVKILDFGVAKVTGEGALTRTGSSVGTPYYMSPEQASGEAIDGRTDVWSLGVVLYEMLAGRRPFSGDHQVAVLNAILHRDPEPLRGWRPEVPEELERLVADALAKDPGERCASISELLARLEPYGQTAGLSGVTRPYAPRAAAAGQSGVSIKTVLLTELADAAGLAAELGDRRLIAASAAHDRRARDLLAEYGGSEVDKTDAFQLVLLFERPIDAVGYALAYHRQVAELSSGHGVEAEARVGLHLGEVSLRYNPPQDVARGAKAIELEGLSRTLAARVLSLAGRRQTLATQGAFDLARRASGDGQPLSEAVRWVAHGSYFFDGFTEPMEVFEIGAEGFAPLAAPGDSERAYRASQAEDAIILGWRPAAGQPLPERRHWILGQKVGEGGFGEVWLASHDKTSERRVFKFCYEAERLKSLEREVTIFRLIREALGSREDIVRILGWNFDQAPYYLESEYTEGGDLADWAAQQGGLAAVPLATRLDLVAQVADALAAAHSLGILHKDVKPANVLITAGSAGEPRIRLTDFGVGAVADRSLLSGSGITLRGLTRDETRATAGTQLYQAPEILEGRVPTIQADIYALGVLLYQMVVGDFSRALARGWRRHVDDDVLRDDVACFVDGTPERRPASAGEIAERLRRLETRRRARQAAERARAAAERARRRRRVLGAAVVALALFGTTMTLQERRARQQAQRAEREAEAARQVSGFLEGLFQMADSSEARGETVTAREILERGAQKIEELEDQPEIQARLMDVMGGVYMSLRLYAQALPLFEEALEKRREIYGPEHAKVADSLNRLARCLWSLTRYREAEPRFREALALRRKLLGEDHESVAETLCELGDLRVETGDLEAAETLYVDCLEIRRRRFAAPHEAIAMALSNLAWVRDFQHRDEAAAELYPQALEMFRRVHGNDHTDVVIVLNNYGYFLMRAGAVATAELYFREASAIDRKLAPEGMGWPLVQSNLALTLNLQQRHQEAEGLARESAVRLEERLGRDDWRSAYAAGILGESLIGLGRFEEAEELLIPSCELMRRKMDQTPHAPQAADRLIALYEAWGKDLEAERYREIRSRYP